MHLLIVFLLISLQNYAALPVSNQTEHLPNNQQTISAAITTTQHPAIVVLNRKCVTTTKS
jgi:hypothetical protein